MINARASATLCLCPPETSVALAFLISPEPGSLQVLLNSGLNSIPGKPFCPQAEGHIVINAHVGNTA